GGADALEAGRGDAAALPADSQQHRRRQDFDDRVPGADGSGHSDARGDEEARGVTVSGWSPFARDQATGFLVDPLARPEGHKVDVVACAEAIDDPESAEAQAPEAFQLVLQRFAQMRLGGDLLERGAQLAFEVRV